MRPPLLSKQVSPSLATAFSVPLDVHHRSSLLPIYLRNLVYSCDQSSDLSVLSDLFYRWPRSRLAAFAVVYSQRMKRSGLIVSFWVLAAFSRAAWQPLPAARNVIVLIPDGCSQSMVTLARWYKNGPLALDAVQAGAVKTHSASSLVTDSAAAATALACGVKTANGVVGAAAPAALQRISPCQPLATVLEAAKHSGRSAGLVVTDDIYGATPASFAAHAASRQADDDIAEQLVYQDLDVVCGGGRARFLPIQAGGQRADGEDLLAVLKARGVRVVETADALRQVTAGKVWALLSPGPMALEIDRGAVQPEQPTLAEMTAKAISLLQSNPRGFFLLVEGSQVDKADHVNDAAAAVREFLAFDEAAAVALAYAAHEGAGRTLVIACPDHDTGGMTIGQRGRTPRTRAELVAPLLNMQVSANALADKIGDDRSAATLAAHVGAWWDVRLTDDEAIDIANRLAARQPLPKAIVEVVDRSHTCLGWTTFDHTGVDVPLWSFGPTRPCGLIDNTDVARAVARALRLDLAAETRARYADAGQAFPEAKLDTTDSANPVLTIGMARLPVNKNILLRAGREWRLSGIVVHMADTGRTYLPQEAVDLLRGARRPPESQ